VEPTAGFEPASSFEAQLQIACFQPLSHVGITQLERKLLPLDGWYFPPPQPAPWRRRSALVNLSLARSQASGAPGRG
jgi:hypothetical protein